MQDSYSLTAHQSRVCRWTATLFLVVGVLNLGAVVATAVRPGLTWSCSSQACSVTVDPVGLLPDEARGGVMANATAQAAFARHVGRPLVRAALTALGLAEGLPRVGLLLGIALALQRLAARRDDSLSTALPWLRRAALCAVIGVLVVPAAESLRAMLLLPGTPMGAYWYFLIDFSRFAVDLMLALAAFVVAWALDAGSRAGRDLAEII